MKTTHWFSALTLALFACSSLADSNDFATLQASGNIVTWLISPDIQYQSIELKLSSGGNVMQTSTEGVPTTPALDDGGYQYELTIAPLLSKAVSDQLKALRANADGQEATEGLNDLKQQGLLPEPKIQSGYFTIKNGQLVTPQAE